MNLHRPDFQVSLNHFNGFLSFFFSRKSFTINEMGFFFFLHFLNKNFWVFTPETDPVLDIGDTAMHMTDVVCILKEFIFWC